MTIPFLIIVEDDNSIRENLVSYIREQKSWEVFDFEKGEDAVNYCKNEKLPDILLMDIELEKDKSIYRSGIKVAGIIKEFCVANNKIMGLVYLTGNVNNDTYIGAAYHHNIPDDYLQKPCSELLLDKKLEIILAKIIQEQTKQQPIKAVQNELINLATNKNIALLLLDRQKQLVCRISNSLIKRKLILFEEFVAAETLKVKTEEGKTKTLEKIVIYTIENHNIQSYEIACTLTDLKQILGEERDFFCGTRFILNRGKVDFFDSENYVHLKVAIKRLQPDSTQDNVFQMSKLDLEKY